jgi:hypothetical protein
MHRGSVVLHERSLGVAPLAPARHLFFAPADAIDQVAAALEKGPERLQKCRLAALDFIRTSLPLAIAGAALIGAARTLVAQPLPAGSMLTPGQTTPSSK